MNFTSYNLNTKEWKNFYLSYSNDHVSHTAPCTLETFGPGVSSWTVYEFEHQNKQSKYAYSNKKSGQGWFCLQVWRNFQNSFMHN